MYGVIKKISQFKLPVKCQLELFDKVIFSLPDLKAQVSFSDRPLSGV
jgi:hypothetical protein